MWKCLQCNVNVGTVYVIWQIADGCVQVTDPECQQTLPSDRRDIRPISDRFSVYRIGAILVCLEGGDLCQHTIFAFWLFTWAMTVLMHCTIRVWSDVMAVDSVANCIYLQWWSAAVDHGCVFVCRSCFIHYRRQPFLPGVDQEDRSYILRCTKNPNRVRHKPQSSQLSKAPRIFLHDCKHVFDLRVTRRRPRASSW